ncbi:MAG: hypothetical protein JXL84_23670 [Deltaproteobacteria bacterium]|nr:hypothetical protein [Deltaproteobacteria bacterium]
MVGLPGPDVKHRAPCPDMQMRNDWVIGKNDVRLRRSRLAGVVSYPAFKAERIQPFDGLSARVNKGTEVVSLKNTFVQPLPGVAMALHYEGRYGKLNVRRATRSVGELGPGKNASVSFSAYDVVPGRRPLSGGQSLVYRAFSIQVTTWSKKIVFDLDESLSSLVRNPPLCPSRKK